MRWMVGRLILFYLGAITVLVGIVPWTAIQPGADITASPSSGFPPDRHPRRRARGQSGRHHGRCIQHELQSVSDEPDDVLSSRGGGYAPAILRPAHSPRRSPQRSPRLGRRSRRRPRRVAQFSESAYVYLFGISLFGGLFAWLMIFITHLYFRPRWESLGRPRLPVRMIGYPYTSWLGILAILGIMVTTWWSRGCGSRSKQACHGSPRSRSPISS